jgi:hypothetical protein
LQAEEDAKIVDTDAAIVRRLHAAERQDPHARTVAAHTAAVNLLQEFDRRRDRIRQVETTFPDFDYETVYTAANMENDGKIVNAVHWLRNLRNLGVDKDTVKEAILRQSRGDIADADQCARDNRITMTIQKRPADRSSSLFILTFTDGSKVTIKKSKNKYEIIPELYTNIKNLGIRKTRQDSDDKLVKRIFEKLKTKGLLPTGIETWKDLKRKLYIHDCSDSILPPRWNGSWRIGVRCEPLTDAQHNAIQQHMFNNPDTYKKELSEMYTLFDPENYKWVAKYLLVVGESPRKNVWKAMGLAGDKD